MSTELKIGFLGAGKMATALARGFLNAKLVDSDGLVASDTMESARAAFTRETGATTTPDNHQVAKSASVLVLAVKPAQVDEVLAELRPSLNSGHLLISIAAGVPLARLEKAAGPARIVRVMPNTPALVGAGATAYALGEMTTPADGQLVQKLLSAVGLAVPVKEPLLDAVTGLSGSGPAYAFLMIEALSDGGVAAGLPRDVALKLAAQTLLGSARLALESGLHPGALKDMVTSPGGTTIEGLRALEQGGVRAALIEAVRVATEKSRLLGRG